MKPIGVDEHILPWSIVGIDGIEGYHFVEAQPDVSSNKKWGGQRVMLAGFKADNNQDDDRIIMYMLVGDYWKVGNFRGCDDPKSVTRFELFKTLLEAVESGADTNALYDAISSVKHIK